MIIKLLVDGGDMKPGPAIAQKLGPLGINIGKVIQEVNKATENFHALKVPVELDVDAKTKNFSISLKSPPVAELLKKELGIEKGSGASKKLKAGNLAIEQIIKIAKTKYDSMLVNNFKTAVKLVVGSCVSIGVLIENKEPKVITNDIVKGVYDYEINHEKTQASEEKLKQLKDYYNALKTKQEEQIKKEEEAKAAAEAEKAAAQPAPSATPAAGAKTAAPAAGAKPEAEKKEEKKEAKKK